MHIQILKFLSGITPYNYTKLYRVYHILNKDLNLLVAAIYEGRVFNCDLDCLAHTLKKVNIKKYTFWQRLKFLFTNKLT